MSIEPTIQQIIDVTGGKESRDGESVVVGYGPLGYYRLTPSTIIRDGQELPAVRIDGRLSRQDGAKSAELREKLRANGIEVR